MGLPVGIYIAKKVLKSILFGIQTTPDFLKDKLLIALIVYKILVK